MDGLFLDSDKSNSCVAHIMINSRKNKGLSLIELLITVSVMGILIAVSLPSFRDTLESMNANTQMKTLLSTLSLARGEAIKRGLNVSLCATDDGADCDADTWSDGWMVFVDANGDADGDSGSVDAGDEIIRVFDAGGDDSTLTFTTDLYQFNGMGFGTAAAVQTFLICPGSGIATNARSLEVAISGRGRRIEDGLACP